MNSKTLVFKNNEFITEIDQKLKQYYNNNENFNSFTNSLYPLALTQLDQFVSSLHEKFLLENAIERKLKEDRLIILKKKLEKLSWVMKETEVCNEILNQQISDMDENGYYKYTNSINSKINLVKANYGFIEKYYEIEEEIARLELELNNNITYHYYNSKTHAYELCNKNKHLIFETLNRSLGSCGLTPLSYLKFNQLLNGNIEDNDELFNDKDMYDY